MTDDVSAAYFGDRPAPFASKASVPAFDATAFHAAFDRRVREVTDVSREALLNQDIAEPTEAQVVGQLLMELVGLDDDDAETVAITKHRLLDIARHMGPDFAQSLYRAAVFMTKVA